MRKRNALQPQKRLSNHNKDIITEKLIECVQKYPCLYDNTHKSYKNHLVSANAWKQIGLEIHETGDVAKKKWKSVRDNYIRYKKEAADCTGQAKKFTKWPWVAQLQFLEKNFRIANYSDTFSETSLPETTAEGFHSEPPHTTISPTSPTTPTSETLHYGQMNTLSTPVRSRARKYRKNGCDMDKVTNAQNKKITEFDAVDHLFQSYAKTFKSFSTQSQIMIKLEMAKLFAEIESKENNLDTHIYISAEDSFPYAVKAEPENVIDIPNYLSGTSDSGASTSADE